MTSARQNFTLSDGRNLEYLTNGVKSDSAIILHAGTTQDITGWQTWLDYIASQNIFALSFGRSGYITLLKSLRSLVRLVLYVRIQRLPLHRQRVRRRLLALR
jgi:hypothetical protein